MRRQEESGEHDWSGTGYPEDAHLPEASVKITVDAVDAPFEPSMTTDLRAVCGLVWVAAAFLGAYGTTYVFAALVGLARGASFDGLLAETAALGAGQLLLFAISISAVYWTINRRPRGAVALGLSLVAFAVAGIIIIGVPLGALPLAGVVPAARNADRGFFERF